MEKGQKEPVSFTSDGSQNTSQEETREDEQKNESLDMILDDWEDSITFGCGRYSTSHQSWHDTIFACSITTKIVGSEIKNSMTTNCLNCSEEVGYLDIPVAKVLSPLVDLQKINLEGGEVTGSRNRSDSSIPCLIKIFSKSDDTQSVKEWILRKALCFSDQPGPSFRAYEGRGVQEKNMVEKLGTLEPPKNVIKAKLLYHQKEGLWWLVSKENSDELPPFWEVKDGLYLNVLTMHRTDRRPDPMHCGIFADDHGLGKTLTLISFDKRPETRAMSVSSALVAKQTLIVTMDFEELKKYDIVLTTYRTLATECFRRRRCPLRKIEWWRVILDEAHLDPLSTKGLFQRPLADGDENVLQVLMATISLRRIKDKVLIGFPSKTVETVSFELSGEERELYDRMKSSSKYFLDFFIFVGILRKRYSFMLSKVLRFRKLCDDSALCSRDLTSLLPSDNIQAASKHPEFLGKMINMIQDGEDSVCAICGCPPNDVVITQCVHVFCKSCIWYYLPRKKLRKPAQVVVALCLALIELLKESSAVNSSSKSVVFSMFDKMVVLLEEPLKVVGFNTLRLEASMDERGQAEIIKGFGSAGPGTVLLASFRTSGFGINLTFASNVYLLEPWWTPADEEQAINRVHQYGQKENVRIVRLVDQNSIEERVLEMQERKKVAAEVVVRQGQKERRAVNMDVCSLLSLST
ncbi:hypothetical protein DKX38_023786 [Salix brachista]|uniref:Helicase C-terminal domain-containing protein n=1 Tax=Salix brachista TaxID=2182728 RepID=A0A5N5JXH1_9ROSI|nr:hypothetical protein DKX38_023786 [Salix brachista]